MLFRFSAVVSRLVDGAPIKQQTLFRPHHQPFKGLTTGWMGASFAPSGQAYRLTFRKLGSAKSRSGGRENFRWKSGRERVPESIVPVCAAAGPCATDPVARRPASAPAPLVVSPCRLRRPAGLRCAVSARARAAEHRTCLRGGRALRNRPRSSAARVRSGTARGLALPPSAAGRTPLRDVGASEGG